MMVHEYCVSWFGYVGCASHSITPDAEAQQRIEGVMKELEKEKASTYKEIAHEFLDQDTYRQGVIWGCNKAIALLKDEVVRE